MRGEAVALLASPLLMKILDGMVNDALERAIAAMPNDDETRRVATTEVRAVRTLKRKLEAAQAAETTPPEPDAVV